MCVGAVTTRYSPACDIGVQGQLTTRYGSFVDLCLHYRSTLLDDIAALHVSISLAFDSNGSPNSTVLAEDYFYCVQLNPCIRCAAITMMIRVRGMKDILVQSPIYVTVNNIRRTAQVVREFHMKSFRICLYFGWRHLGSPKMVRGDSPPPRAALSLCFFVISLSDGNTTCCMSSGCLHHPA